MATTGKLAQKLSTAAESWAHDPFRPNLQLSNFLKSLARHPRLTPEAVQATRTLQRDEVKTGNILGWK